MIDSSTRRFTELTELQCRELLRTRHVGRIAWQAAHGPQILPVAYVCYQDSVVFRTSPYGVLSELVRPADVALEIDELDQEHRSGWSVMVQGRAAAVAEPVDLVQLWTVDALVPWAPGVRNLFIQIEPRRLSGRLLRALRDADEVRSPIARLP